MASASRPSTGLLPPAGLSTVRPSTAGSSTGSASTSTTRPPLPPPPPPSPAAQLDVSRLARIRSVDAMIARSNEQASRTNPFVDPAALVLPPDLPKARNRRFPNRSVLPKSIPESTEPTASRSHNRFFKRFFSRNDKSPTPKEEPVKVPEVAPTSYLEGVRVRPSPYHRPLKASNYQARREKLLWYDSKDDPQDSEQTETSSPIAKKSSPQGMSGSGNATESSRESYNSKGSSAKSSIINALRDRELTSLNIAADAKYVQDWGYWLKCYAEGKYNISNPPDTPPRKAPFECFSAPIPNDEDKRLEAYEKINIPYSTSATKAAQHLVDLARKVCKTEHSAMSFFDNHDEIFKAGCGYVSRNISRKVSIGAHLLLSGGEPMIVLDTLKDWRFDCNPLVHRTPRIRFYAAAPLMATNGQTVGVMAVFDPRPRQEPDMKFRRALLDFAKIATTDLEVLVERHYSQGSSSLSSLAEELERLQGHGVDPTSQKSGQASTSRKHARNASTQLLIRLEKEAEDTNDDPFVDARLAEQLARQRKLNTKGKEKATDDDFTPLSSPSTSQTSRKYGVGISLRTKYAQGSGGKPILTPPDTPLSPRLSSGEAAAHIERVERSIPGPIDGQSSTFDDVARPLEQTKQRGYALKERIFGPSRAAVEEEKEKKEEEDRPLLDDDEPRSANYGRPIETTLWSPTNIGKSTDGKVGLYAQIDYILRMMAIGPSPKRGPAFDLLYLLRISSPEKQSSSHQGAPTETCMQTLASFGMPDVPLSFSLDYHLRALRSRGVTIYLNTNPTVDRHNSGYLRGYVCPVYRGEPGSGRFVSHDLAPDGDVCVDLSSEDVEDCSAGVVLAGFQTRLHAGDEAKHLGAMAKGVFFAVLNLRRLNIY